MRVTRIELKSRAGTDGVLSLRVPLGSEDADREVVVTVEPVDGAASAPELDREAWLRFIDETAGRWEGPPLVRPDQGTFEKREDWG
jgi:hypothetical protein